MFLLCRLHPLAVGSYDFSLQFCDVKTFDANFLFVDSLAI